MKINVYGHCFGSSGWAQHAVYFANALGSLYDVRLVAWNSPDPSGESNPKLTQTGKPFPNADVAIGIGPIDRMPEMVGRRRVGFMVWETTIVPKAKLQVLRALDEVWVPSTWGRTILIDNGLSGERVHVVPEGVDPSVFQPCIKSQAPNHPFRFLCVGKWEERKGIADLAIAYSREFATSEPVELILHCFNPYLKNFSIDGALAALKPPEHAPIRPSSPIGLESLIDLYNKCDAFVLATKGEGWGLPMTEAMSCGLPVIATNYSAQTDYMHEDNGYLIDVARMVPVDDVFFYGAEEELGVWAQPDLEHLQHLMRLAYANNDERASKAAKAQTDIANQWTWKHAAQVARNRLEAI